MSPHTIKYTIVHYTVFDVHVTHKKSSFLVIGGLFGLHDDLAAILCTPSSLLLINPILVSEVGVAKGASSHFKLIGGFPLVERVVIVCLRVLAILYLPEEFI